MATTAVCAVLLSLIVIVSSQDDFNINNRIWVTRLKSANKTDAILLAKRNGFRFHKQVTGFPDIYIFEATGSGQKWWSNTGNKRSRLPQKSLDGDEGVVWASQQKELTRQKRDVFYYDSEDNYFDGSQNIDNRPHSNEIERHRQENSREFAAKPLFNDEFWDQEWYLQDTRTEPGLPKLDLNVLPVYRRGITGKGVRVAVLDDGIEYFHEDLYPNFDPEISYDCNNDIPDASPNYSDRSNSHGTRCAGEIAMVANNRKCGVGIAYGVKIGGIKLLSGKVYDLIEGMALGFAHNKIDIYSSSWGPTDDGRTLEKPGKLAQEAIYRGITKGRNGRGSIYVWASGNGGSRDDNCNCDGYAASIYTIAVGSASQYGKMPWYGEKCPSMLTVTYSSGAYEDQMITTTDLGNKCTLRHTGTSASAPLAAGIIALGLEANPNTTWRDVQHLIVNTAEYLPLSENEGWLRNAAGFLYNIRFGFGLMNADFYVTTASTWKNVGPQIVAEISTSIEDVVFLDSNMKSAKLTFNYNLEDIQFLEHVEIILDMEYSERGVLEFYLTSPQMTKIQLLSNRARDKSKQGFKNWTLMSVATWSENPNGIWLLQILDKSPKGVQNSGYVKKATLRLHGTKEQPDILKEGPRKYNKNYIRNIYM